MDMNNRKHKGLRISEIGFGCYGLSGAYGSMDVEDYKSTINRAYELGVNFFDTAEAYGGAEKILGEVVMPHRQEVIIATKVGIKEGFKPNLSRKYVKEACEQSLKALQTEYIDLYQVHFDDPETPVEETVGALEELVTQGIIRNYGLSHLPLARIKTYFEIGNPFSVLMEFSAVSRSAMDELLPACRDNDVGAIAFSVTGRGLLTGKIKEAHSFEAGDIRNMDPLFQRERFRSGLRVSNKMSELGKKYGKTQVQVAIAWVLSQPGVICALTGPSTIPHLEENLGGSGWTIDAEDLDALETFFKGEEEHLKREQHKSIEQILSTQILGEPSKAFVDLVYVIETSILLGLTTEAQIMPIFMDLYGLREYLDQGATPKLEDIRERLTSFITID